MITIRNSLICCRLSETQTCNLCQMYSFVFFVIIYFCYNINFVSAESIDICKSDIKLCSCRFDRDVDNDFLFASYLDCSFTGAQVLHNDSYVLPKIVNSLSLSSNKINTIVKSNVFISQTMEKLTLSKNNISNIETDSFDLPRLERMDLSENVLTYLDPETFRNVKKLKYLNLAYNKFTHFVDMQLHHLAVLEELILDGNNIGQSLSNTSLFHRHGLAINEGIKRLSMAAINLTDIHDNLLTNAYDLRYLSLSNNNIAAIPELPFTLEYLDASANPIRAIYFEDFSNLLALKELRLNNIQIKQVFDFVFEPLKALRVLELERNANLTAFSALAFGREVLDDPDNFMLELLSLKSSRLATLSPDLEIPFGQLQRLDLQGNMWKCDCNLVWIKRLQIKSKDNEYLR